MVFFTDLSLMEFQVRYLAIFLLFSVIVSFRWFWMGSLPKNIHLMQEFLKEWSILGPTLSLLYINGLCDDVIFNIGIYAGIKITDFQTPGKMSDTIKYLLNIHWTSFQRVWVLEFKCPEFVNLLKCIMTTFGVHQYSFREINTCCVITFQSEKSYSGQKASKQ